MSPAPDVLTFEEKKAKFWAQCAIVKDSYGGLPWHVVPLAAPADGESTNFIQIPYQATINGSPQILTRCNFSTKRSLLASVDWALGKPE